MNKVNRTWSVPRDLAGRVIEQAHTLGVFPSDLVAYLLTFALDQVDTGKLAVPTQPRVVHSSIKWPGPGKG